MKSSKVAIIAFSALTLSLAASTLSIVLQVSTGTSNFSEAIGSILTPSTQAPTLKPGSKS